MPRGRGTLTQRGQRGSYLALGTNFQVDVVALKDTTREVGLVRITTAQSLKSGLLVSKRFKKVSDNLSTAYREESGEDRMLGCYRTEVTDQEPRAAKRCGVNSPAVWLVAAASRGRAQVR